MREQGQGLFIVPQTECRFFLCPQHPVHLSYGEPPDVARLIGISASSRDQCLGANAESASDASGAHDALFFSRLSLVSTSLHIHRCLDRLAQPVPPLPGETPPPQSTST